jgi:hypothetical protein
MTKINDLVVEEITLVAPKGAENIELFITRNLGTILEIKHKAYRIVLYPDMDYLAKQGSVYTFSNGKLNLFI